MKTNEVEKKTGFSKQTLMYYEREGLIHPSREKNSYRNYSDQDVQILTVIKLLRSMNISIDDIKMVLNQQLSFQECLETQSLHMEETMKELEAVKETIDFYKEKHVPMIPSLKELDNIKTSSWFGFKKTTPTITLGRKPTRQYAIKTFIYFIMISVLMGAACMVGFHQMMHRYSLAVFLISALAFFLFFIISYGAGIGQMHSFHISNHALSFIEFNETGILYCDANSFISRITYVVDLLKGKEDLKYYPYEDITMVKIKHVKRYLKIPGSNIATETITDDYYFTFNDGSNYNLVHPMTLENDQKILNTILKEKVKFVIEEN